MTEDLSWEPDPDFWPDDFYQEPIGSCEWCGVNLYPDDDPWLRDQCAYLAEQAEPAQDDGWGEDVHSEPDPEAEDNHA